MALIIEDGTIVSNANSYVGVTEMRSFLGQFNQNPSQNDDLLCAALAQAFFFINTLEPWLSGSRTSSSQTAAYPRENLVIYGNEIANNVIPDQVKHLQIYAAYEQVNGNDLEPNSDGRVVISESIPGCYSKSYSDKSVSGSTMQLGRVNNALSPLTAGGRSSFRVSRA